MKKGLPHKQKGAAAIEFALVFVIFFAVLYGLISYSLPLLIMQSFNHATAEGVRRSMAVDPASFQDDASYKGKLRQVVDEVIGEQLAWMPEHLRTSIIYPYDDYPGGIMTVTLSLPSNALSSIMPVLRLGTITVPQLPVDLKAQSSLKF